MSTVQERSRYDHSLLALCERIHCAWTGSGDGIPTAEAESLREWLEWRLGDGGWHKTMHAAHQPYDDAVHVLCRIALAELKQYCVYT